MSGFVVDARFHGEVRSHAYLLDRIMHVASLV